MARRTAHEAALTRLRILSAAAGVFCRQGIARSTLEDVARQAGVTRGAVYGHFKGKHDLLVELLDAATLPIEQMPPSESLAQDCEHLTAAVLATVRSPKMRRVMRLLMQRADIGQTQAHIQRRFRSVRKCFTAYLTQVLNRAFLAGELAPGYCATDLPPLVMAMRAGLNGLMLELLANPREPEQRVREVLRLIFVPLTHASCAEAPEVGPAAIGREAGSSCPVRPGRLRPAGSAPRAE